MISAWMLVGPVIGMLVLAVSSVRMMKRYGDTILKVEDLERALRRAQSGGNDTMPLPLADAEAAIFMIDRVPEDGPDFQLGHMAHPVIWMHPRLQRSWRWNNDGEHWIENTDNPQGDCNHLVFATDSSTFGYAMTAHVPGIRQTMRSIASENTSPDEVTALVASLPDPVVTAMNRTSGSNEWSEVAAAGRRPVQPAAPRLSARDNPFADVRRPIIVDDNPA